MPDNSQKSPGRITLMSFIVSLFAGWFGVQSKANRERDFEHGKFSHFIIGGVIFAIVFVLFIVGIVNIVLSTTSG